jgi:hypothetical protein
LLNLRRLFLEPTKFTLANKSFCFSCSGRQLG